MRHALLRGAAVTALVTALAAGCGSDDDDSASTDAPTTTVASGGSAPNSDAPTNGTPGSAAPAGGATLVIANFAFGEVSGAKAGQPIQLRNDDSTKHTVTADDGTFDVQVDASGTGTLTVDRAGTYAFHCTIHPSMSGSLQVG